MDPPQTDAAPAAEGVPNVAAPAARPGQKRYKQIVPPSPESIMQEDFMNNCATRTVISGLMGIPLGVLFGIFMGAMDGAGGSMDGSLAAAEAEKQTARQVAKQMFTTMRSRSVSYAKGFASLGAIYAGSECVIEKTRAKHDIYNSVYAGCFTGGALAARAGPQAACAGCAMFAAFSAMMDKFMGHD